MTGPIRVGVHGAGGRMGQAASHAIAADDALTLAALVGRGLPAAARDGITSSPDREAFLTAECAVVVDFTAAAAARETVPWLVDQGIHAVVGTTGLDDNDLAAFHAAAAPDSAGNVLVAANFSISAALTMRFAELAAPFFDTAEVIELHHDGKVDAPSGTAIATARRIAAASADWAPDPTTSETIPGARGASGPGGIRIHAVRMRGMVAHQEVVFGARGQTLTLRQDSYDRESFMPGVLLAVKRVAELPGLTIGLDALLAI
jgi:4-hydroxy-tetrahydrodipicolinate reductase